MGLRSTLQHLRERRRAVVPTADQPAAPVPPRPPTRTSEPESASLLAGQPPVELVSYGSVSHSGRQQQVDDQPAAPPNVGQNEPQGDAQVEGSQTNGQPAPAQQTHEEQTYERPIHVQQTDGTLTDESRIDGSQTGGSETSESHTDESQPDALQTQTDASDRWTAAYKEAVSQVDESIRTALVGRGKSLEELFENLSDLNEKHKAQSIFRRGMELIQKPLQFLDVALSTTEPLASFDPAASTAFGLVRSVTTLAVGVCGIEERLNSQIKKMLEQIDIIDECDTLGQNLDAGIPIHLALVVVYKDLLAFYHVVIQVLERKSTALAYVSEQFNERIPPVIDEFFQHAEQLRIHISNATSQIVKSIESLLIDAKIQQLLGSNKISQLDAFHIDLKNKTANEACQWVINQQTFRTWYNATAPKPLTIYGDMGCGKTITMSFIIEHVSRLSDGQIPRPVICYHYCRDDETGKSLYIYSSLIQQLMRQKSRIKVEFDRWCDDRRNEGYQAPTQDSTMLARFFFDSVKSLKRPVFVFLDGIDECEDQSRHEVITSLQQHSHSIPELRVCVSARYHEEICDLLKGSSEIRMQAEAGRDAIMASYMVKKKLPFLDQEARDFVIQRLTELARGSAIWVQMAVDLLATRKTRALGKLRTFLRDELPQSGLSDLYAKLFVQVTQEDGENEKVLTDALEVLAVAERPLSILELGWAVALRDAEADVQTVQDLTDYVDTKRVLGLVTPFIAGVDFENSKGPQIRVVHQSVRELILQAPPAEWTRLRSSAPRKHELIQRRSELHGKFVRTCTRYLLMSDLKDKELFSEEQTWAQAVDEMPGMDFFGNEDEDNIVDSSDRAAGEVASNVPAENQHEAEETSKFDPSDRGFGEFYTYASCYWLHHLRSAGEEHGLALSDVITLTTPQTQSSRSWWEQYYRPDCTLRPDESQLRPYCLETLAIVSLYGPESLWSELLQQVNHAKDNDFTPAVSQQRESAVYAILRQGELGSLNRLTQLIQYSPGNDLQEAMDLFGVTIRTWAQERCSMTPERQKGFDVVFDHIEGAFDIMVEQGWGNQLLCSAASQGCLPVVTRLFNAAARNPALKAELLRTPHRDNGRFHATVHHQSIGDAAWNGHGDVVAFLLEQDGIDAHLRYKDITGKNVFHKAARGGDVKTLKLLISRFPEGVNERDEAGETPLKLLVFGRRPTELVRFLLEEGQADVRSGYTETSNWYEPLRMATRYGDIAMCQTLVRHGGADPMSVFKPGKDFEFIDSLDCGEDMAVQMRETLLSLNAEKRLEGAYV